MVAVLDLADAGVFTDTLVDFNEVLMDSTIDESVQDAQRTTWPTLLRCRV